MADDIYLAAVDMSLLQGGLFDFIRDWQPPHEYHRVGQSVDFSSYYRDLNGEIVTVDVIRDGALLPSTNMIDQSVLDDCFDREGFDRWESPDLIHYEYRTEEQ